MDFFSDLELGEVRLPNHVRPTKYKVTIKPMIETALFQGEVDITLDISQASDVIYLHQTNLTFTAITITQLKLEESPQITIPPEPLDALIAKAENYIEDIYAITCGMELQKGSYLLHMEYSGAIHTQLFEGLYITIDPRYIPNSAVLDDRRISQFEDPELRKKMLKHTVLATHFEPCYARQVIPVFDEPAFKAVFQLNLYVSDAEMKAISNMEPESVESTPQGMLYKFKESPYMSNYLLSFVVGHFHKLEAISPKKGVGIGIYLPEGREEEGSLALSLAKNCLDFYSEYFGEAYPLPKLDLVSLHQMQVRAMENWGCITFVDYALLTDEKSTRLEMIHRCARTVCHEISHMWFGNLVTMEWWEDLWLNEGFARFMEHSAVAKFMPQYNIWEKFLEQVYELALTADSKSSTHPIQVHCTGPSQIRTIFDTISYAKGASVIKMLSFYMEEEKFKLGTSQYIQKYKHANAKTEDLWAAFAAHDPKIPMLMSVWTKTPGYPIVFVERGEAPDELHLLQRRYKAKMSMETMREGTGKQIWPIPIVIKTAKGIKRLIMETESISIKVDGLTEKDWVKINDEQHGFYRVHYAPSLLKLLLLDIQNLSTPNRYGIFNDLLAFWWDNGSAEYLKVLIESITYLKGESSYIVWEVLNKVFKRLLQTLIGAPRVQLKAFIAELFYGLFKEKGGFKWKITSDLDYFTIATMVRWIGISGGNKEVMKEAADLFHNNKENKWLEINSEIRAEVYKVAVSLPPAPDNKTIVQELLLQHLKLNSQQMGKDELCRVIEGLSYSEYLQSDDVIFIAQLISTKGRLTGILSEGFYIRAMELFANNQLSSQLFLQLLENIKGPEINEIYEQMIAVLEETDSEEMVQISLNFAAYAQKTFLEHKNNEYLPQILNAMQK